MAKIQQTDKMRTPRLMSKRYTWSPFKKAILSCCSMPSPAHHLKIVIHNIRIGQIHADDPIFRLDFRTHGPLFNIKSKS